MASPTDRKAKQAKLRHPKSAKPATSTKPGTTDGQQSRRDASDELPGPSAVAEPTKWRALTNLPLAGGVTLLFVMGFHSLIDDWPAGSVVTMFYILSATGLWLVQKLLRRRREPVDLGN